VTANATSPSENSAPAGDTLPWHAEEMWLLMVRPVHDTRREPVGGFAEPVAPDDLVGSYANRRRERRRACGSFAGDAHDQRRGCLADTDRMVVVPPGPQPTTEDSDPGRPDTQQSTTRISRDRSVTVPGERSNQ
jgi:hypothetical protein